MLRAAGGFNPSNVSSNVLRAISMPSGLDRWFAAYADSLNAPVFVPCVGDSTVYGLYADGTGSGDDAAVDAGSWPGQLRALFARQFGIAETGYITAADSRTVKSGGAAVGSLGLGALAQSISSAGPATLTFSLPACTGFDIVYYESNGSTVGGNLTPTTGAFAYAIDGGGSVPVAYAGTVDTYKVAAATGLPDAAHSVVITGTSANLAYICGVRYHKGAGVSIGRCGRSGFTSSDLLGLGTGNSSNAAGVARLKKAFTSLSPALVVISVGHNDCTLQLTAGQLTTLAVYRANLQSMIDAATGADGGAGVASVLLVSEPDPNNAPVVGGSSYRSYWQVARDLALQNPHVAHFSIADVWGDFQTAKASGYCSDASGVHPLRKGYGSIARMVHQALLAGEQYRAQLS